MIILGISAFYHDSAIAIVEDGKILFAAQEERYSRVKHDSSFPVNAISAAFDFLNINWDCIDIVVYYDKPWLKFERIVETYYGFAPFGFTSFKTGLPVWIKEKVFLPKLIHEYVPSKIPLKFSNHHLSHASSAFYPSPFNESAILTLDGVGEWATTTISYGEGSSLKMLKAINFPHSLGLLYSSFTYFCGFKVNSGEYKLMGLAPYGRKDSIEVLNYKKIITQKLCKIYEDGSFWLDQKYFSYCTKLEMTNTKLWEELFGVPRRTSEGPLSQAYCDLALAIQEVTQEIVVKLAKYAKKITGSNNLCLAGGVALNCVANGLLVKEKIFDNIWIQPAAGDAGGALGAALGYFYSLEQNCQREVCSKDSMNGSYLAESYTNEIVEEILKEENISYQKYLDKNELNIEIANKLSASKVVGWFQGRMEFGPRSLGARSILASAEDFEMQKILNLKIKYRESFRPFAPVILEEDCKILFKNNIRSPYMLFVDELNDEFRFQKPDEFDNFSLNDKLYFKRSKFQTITHLDYSARIQTVSIDENRALYELLNEYKKITGFGILANTSFNVRGEPIVASPKDALKCFFQTEMDVLVLNDFVILKSDQSLETLNYYRSLPQNIKPD